MCFNISPFSPSSSRSFVDITNFGFGAGLYASFRPARCRRFVTHDALRASLRMRYFAAAHLGALMEPSKAGILEHSAQKSSRQSISLVTDHRCSVRTYANCHTIAAARHHAWFAGIRCAFIRWGNSSTIDQISRQALMVSQSSTIIVRLS